MADLKIWVENNMFNFQQTGNKQPYGRADIEARYTNTTVSFFHKQKKYLKEFDSSQSDFLFSEIQDQAGTPVGATIDLIQTYLSDKIGNFKIPGGAGGTIPVGADGDLQYKDGANLGGTSNVNYNSGTNTLSVPAKSIFSNNTAGTPYITEDFESGDLTGFTTDGNAVWTVDTVDADQGTYSARSGVITGNQSSNLHYTATATATVNAIRFRYRVSSEPVSDFLNFYVDNVLVAAYSGEVPWTTAVIPITAGLHAFKWEYKKDPNTNTGSDLARIDLIQLEESVNGFENSAISLFTNTVTFDGITYFNNPVAGLLETISDITVNGHRIGLGGGNNQTNLVVGGEGSGSLLSGAVGQNVLLGYIAAPLITTGDQNVFVGVNASDTLVGGNLNTFIGTNTGRGIVNGNYNTIVGGKAYNPALSDQSNLVLLHDGQNNIAFQRNASNEHTLPLQTIATITSGGAKSIATQEYVSSVQYAHPNHTGEVTSAGDGAQTLSSTSVTNKTTVTSVIGDFVLISDTSDSGNLKKVNASDFLPDPDTVLKNVVNIFTKQQYFLTQTLTDTANISWDLDNNQVAVVTLTANRILANPTNMKDGGTYILRIIQGGAGSFTISFGNAYVSKNDSTTPFTQTLSTAAGSFTTIAFTSDGTKMIS